MFLIEVYLKMAVYVAGGYPACQQNRVENGMEAKLIEAQTCIRRYKIVGDRRHKP